MQEIKFLIYELSAKMTSTEISSIRTRGVLASGMSYGRDNSVSELLSKFLIVAEYPIHYANILLIKIYNKI